MQRQILLNLVIFYYDKYRKNNCLLKVIIRFMTYALIVKQLIDIYIYIYIYIYLANNMKYKIDNTHI